MAATAMDVAKWMLAELDRDDLLYQEVVVHAIADEFGDKFTYINDNGNLAIAKPVLAAFRQLTGDSVVWERGERLWRRRENYDADGRQQD